MNKFLTNLGQEFTETEKTIIKNKIESILGTDQVKMAWIPTISNDGTISWQLAAYSSQAPNPTNIRGPQGEKGENGTDGEPGTSVTIANIEEEGRTHVVKFSDGKSITITDGVDGAGVAIKGTVATKANLPTDAENGDAYIVTSEDGKLFVYADGWPDDGVAFTGPKGERGETPSFSFIDGETGIEIHVNDSEEPVAVIPYATDGRSPSITTSATSTGNVLYVDGEPMCTILNGTNGTNGTNGYTPSLTSQTVTSTDDTNKTGTELTFTYPESWQTDVVFTAWNGTDGKDWEGTTGRLLQGDFIKLTPTGDDLEISVTGDFVTSSTIVGTDQYALTTAGWAKVQGGEGRTYLFDSDTLSGDGTEGNEIGVDTSVLAGMYLPLSGTSEGKTVSGTVVFENCHLTITNTGNAATYDAAATATNGTDVFPFAMGAWIKRHEIGNDNGNMAALGVVRADLIEDIFKASQDPNNCINYTSKTPVCMLQVGGDTNPWGGWATRLMFAQQVHSGTITDDTIGGWSGDNTLHFILE